jgi:glycosyltransferase involved in cell wall biosynthesis
MPFFNEEALLPSLPALYDRIHAALAGHDVRLLAIDDGSTDGTRAGLIGIDIVSHETNRGVGAAMETGLLEATGDAVIVYDPDEAYPAESLAALVEALEHADLATLSPYHPDGSVEGVGWFRLLLSRGASWLYRRRLSRDIHTYTCAVRAYRLPQATDLLPAPADFTAAAHLMARAIALDWRIAEVPAKLVVRRDGSSKMRVGRTIRAHLRLLRDLAVTAGGSKGEP